MPSVTVVAATKPIGSSAVVVGAFAGPNGPQLAPGAESVDAAISGQLLSAYRSAGGNGQPDDVVKIPTLGLAPFPLVAVTGLGPAEAGAVDGAWAGAEAADQVRRAVAAAVRSLPMQTPIRICLDPGLDPATLVSALGLGAVLGRHRFTGYKSSPSVATSGPIEITTATPDRAVRAALRRAIDIGEAVTMTRDLVNQPPNDLYPASFAARLSELAAGLPIEVEVLDERALARQGFQGILAVGRGSARGPRLVRLNYRPARPRARVALVGEGTTFNSGGLNLKTTQMSWTKADMAGAAATAAAIFAAARRWLPIEITATIPMVENLPSATSYRPSDVVSVRGGRTVEVTDTEASGRLTLIEAIHRAVADEPDYLIEASSLTAAQRVALGPRMIAAMGDPLFRDRVVTVAADAGETLWPMPLPADLRGGLDSPVADLATVAPNRWGAMLVGGAFLADFVPAGLPWVHLDITGPAWNIAAAHGYTPKGGTGAGVATIFGVLESIATDG
jgi:leucyl aminopeptidase